MFAWIKTIIILPFNVLVIIPSLILYFSGYNLQFGNTFSLLLGGIMLFLGFSLACWTMNLFAKRGKGTAAPWNPPKRLVIHGPYCHVRNPMMTSVFMMLIAEILILNSVEIFSWFAIFFTINALYIPLIEEKELEKRFGDDYKTYKQNVPRWIPRLSAWNIDSSSKFLAIGIMTGNSLDAVDLVLTQFSPDGKIHDLVGYSLDYPKALSDALRKLRVDIANAEYNLESFSKTHEFKTTHDYYIETVASGVEGLIKEAEKIGVHRQDIDAIGFHGQTCGHNPPSIAKKPEDVYTIQIGNGQMLSDMTGITVIYDFRSDDIFNGGEGAPFAPVHNLRIAKNVKEKGFFPVAFCNAGNTGNITVISTVNNQDKVLGWDIGPFNHFIDMLVREETADAYDHDGKYGKHGNINVELLREMFNQCAVRADGSNFILASPPKSSDPQWYRAPTMLKSANLKFEDRLRTAEYFSAYSFVYSLKYIPQDMAFPNHFLVFGGGWKNPLVMQDFQNLLLGKGIILEEHKAVFEQIWSRAGKNVSNIPKVVFSDEKGFSAKYMEARIFADMAYCRVINEPFTLPEISGANKPTVCGIICYPQKDPNNSTANFRDFIARHNSGNLPSNSPNQSPYYSRAYPRFKR